MSRRRLLALSVPAALGQAALGQAVPGLAVLGLAQAASVAAPVDGNPHAIAVFGDSQAEGLAVALRRVARLMPGVKVQNHTKAGTAISQPENYDWPAIMSEYVPDAGVDTAVLMFGGNDRLPIRPAEGAAIAFRSAAWDAEYRLRTAAIVRSLADKRLRIIWVGNPICRDSRYSQDMAYLNAIYREELAGGAGVYLDIWTVVADADSHYAAYGHTLNGATARLRLDDGIHFTPSGYDLVATRVMRVAGPAVVLRGLAVGTIPEVVPGMVPAEAPAIGPEAVSVETK